MTCSFANRYEQFLLKLFIPCILDQILFQCPNKCSAFVDVTIIEKGTNILEEPAISKSLVPVSKTTPS